MRVDLVAVDLVRVVDLVAIDLDLMKGSLSQTLKVRLVAPLSLQGSPVWLPWSIHR